MLIYPSPAWNSTHAKSPQLHSALICPADEAISPQRRRHAVGSPLPRFIPDLDPRNVGTRSHGLVSTDGAIEMEAATPLKFLTSVVDFAVPGTCPTGVRQMPVLKH